MSLNQTISVGPARCGLFPALVGQVFRAGGPAVYKKDKTMKTCGKCGSEMPEPKPLPGQSTIYSWQEFCPACIEAEARQQQEGLDLTQAEDRERDAKRWARSDGEFECPITPTAPYANKTVEVALMAVAEEVKSLMVFNGDLDDDFDFRGLLWALKDLSAARTALAAAPDNNPTDVAAFDAAHADKPTIINDVLNLHAGKDTPCEIVASPAGRIAELLDQRAALLSALRGLLEAYAPRAQETVDATGENSLHSSVRDARAAIARAEGGQP